MKRKSSKFKVLLALILALTILLLPMDTLALVGAEDGATPDEAAAAEPEETQVTEEAQKAELSETGASPLNGDGSQGNPYIIASADDWDALADSVLNGTSYEGKIILLEEDITVTRSLGHTDDISSASSPSYEFDGTFDGGGHTMTFTPPADSNANYVAPFSIVKNATIRNLKVEGEITAFNNLSGLVGAPKGTLLVENVLVDVDVEGNFIGGFVGHGVMADMTFRSCAFTGNLNGDTLAGGFVCWRGPVAWEASGNPALHIENCLFAGSASGAADFHPIGFTQQTNVSAEISDMWATADGQNNGKGFYNYQYQGTSYRSTAATVVNGISSSRPWMGYFDVIDCPPVEGTFADALNVWTAGSTLALLTDVTTDSTINAPSGEHALDLNGYGILMTGNDRVITVNQGASLELNDSDPDRIHYITLTNYRGTAVSDSGEESVSSGNGVIKVTGGYLTGGYRNNSGSHDKCGAGVYNWGTFVMNGGSIVGNTLYNNSGGAIRNSGYFTMNGGTIAFNYASGNGGGVTTYVPGGSQGKMTMNGGEISDNYCGSYGGGIQIAGPIEMTGGSVVRNTAGAGGSGIFYDGKNDRFKLSGDPVIKDNSNNDDLYLGANATFMINDSLTEGADIHILMNTPAEFTVGWKNIMGNADPSKYFTGSNSGYAVILNNNGEVEIGIPPAASIISGETATNYNSISDAISAWTEGSTLKLLADVTTSGTVNVPSGEHTLDLNGHGITMTGSGSVISLNSGAKLSFNDSNKEAEHRFTVSNAQSNGAGLATVDDSLTSGYKTFKGGYITGGNAREGGGIFVGNNAYLTLNGGTIIGNRSNFMGAGVKVSNNGDNDGKCFTMNGGSIIYNSISGYGSGVCSDAGVTINDGTIAYNYASNYPGGVHGHYLYISGGRIENNFACNSEYAAGVHADHEVFLSGDTVIYGNLCNGSPYNLDWDRVEYNHGHMINITGALSEEAKIGVTMRISGTGTFTNGWKDKMGNADPAKYFTSDNDNYLVFLNGNEAELALPPVASVTSGGTTTNYSSVSDAVNAWTGGSTLKLLADITTSSTVTVPSGEHTLDLNGYTLKAGSTGYSVVTVGSGANLTIDDTSDNVGKITGGSVGQNYGGGVTVDGGTLTLRDGAISGNANTYGGIGNCGGGVHVRSGGKFYMQGGEISGNTSYVGGGVCADSSATTVSVIGGVIKNNITQRFASGIWAGRTDSSVFILGGDAQIIDNISTWTSDKDGEASINFVSTLMLSGNPTVHGDWKTSGTSSPNTHINLDNDGSGVQRVELDGALTNDTGTPKITVSPIYRWNDLANGQTFVFTKNWNQYMGTAHPADYFKLDDSVSGVRVIRKDGEAAFTGSSDLGDLYITFDANKGEGAMEPQLATSATAALNENTFTRDGYVFAGWNTKADGSGTSYADKDNITLTGDLTLYAQWTEKLFEGKGTEEEPYLIQSADDWDALSNYINSGGTSYNGKNFKLTKNISVTTVLGNRPNTSSDSEDNFFSGTFDGDNHTLDVNINDQVFAAPFAVANNATIKNLHVTGTVTSTGNHATGLVAASKGRSIYDPGTLTIQNVTVSADISCNSHIAGIVGHAHQAVITMENVVFDGSLSASSIQGGMIGWGGLGKEKFSASFKDCLFAGTYRSGASFYPVAYQSGQGTVTLINDFYTTSLGSGGSPITPTGDGQVKLLAVTVEKDGKVKYFESIATASGSENWTAGSTLKLMTNVTTSSTITVPSGAHNLDLNGYTVTRTGATGNDNSGLAMTVGNGVDLTVTGPGKITGGKGFHGGGIHVEGSSSVVLDNCEISGNTGHYGGGLYLKNGTITLKNGTVVKQNSASEGYGGSGIYAEGGGTLILEGGTFTENEIRNGNQYAVFLCGNANMMISGAPVIYDNTYSGAQKNLYMFQAGDQHSSVLIIDALTNGTKIGVGQTTGTGVITGGWKDKMGDAKPEDYFTSDNADYVVSLNQDGEAEIGYPLVPDVSAEGFEGDYDGEAHGITVSAPDGATIEYGTEEGSYTLTENPTYTDAGAYTVYYKVSQEKFTSVCGSAEIKINQINAVVTITGKNSTADYDGKTHSVSGYTAAADTALYDVSKDFTFSGTAQAERTDVGKTDMGLTAERFENTNKNFKTVTFNVTDGYIEIKPINVTVTITGHNNTVNYDGSTHSADGYDAKADSDLYDVTKDFTFSGRAEAVRTDAGTTDMGLTADKFENTNTNFATVTFEVTDGYITVNPIDVIVTIIGHNDTADYDGKAHKISGYDAKADSELYDVTKDFTFSGTAEAQRTDAGTTNMGLTAEQYANTNSNFKTVTFNVTDGYMTINPVDVTVKITGHTDTVDYDGEVHAVSGYDFETDNKLYTEADFIFSGTAEAERTDAGKTEMGLEAGQFENTNSNFKKVTFNVTDGSITVNPIDVTVTITGHTYTADYDGESHSVSGYEADASSDLYDVENDFTFTGTAEAERTDAGTTEMGLNAGQYENTNGNFKNVTFDVTDGTITVNPIDVTVTITGHTDTFDYDGKAHTVSGYDAEADSDLYDVAEDFTFSGTAEAIRTDNGVTQMNLNADQFENINSNFKNVTFVIIDGYIAVDPIDVIVTITGYNSTDDYDGNAHTVSGYEVTTDNPLYDESDFTFSGTAEAQRIDAGTSYMGLEAEQFENTNSNFENVAFVINDGYQKIDPIDVTVTITGHSNTVDYNGSAHSADGYDAVASSDLYDVTKDFTFTGRAETVRTAAGTTNMGLDAGQFANTNSNFANVTFEVTDGYITVNPINVTVTITGHNSTVDYDGTAHKASGYDVSIGNSLYQESDFTFSGTAEAQRTDAGKTDMGLAAGQFTNTNGNFKTVTFNVTDGYITINTVDAVLTSAPHAKDKLVYTGSNQELIVAGTAEGGSLYYALGSDSKTAPDDSEFSTAVPVGKDVGNYYIWYKVIADSNHNSIAPACVKITLAEKDWTTVSGRVYDSSGDPVRSATVTLTLGGKTVDTIISGSDGGYYFTAPAGVYNIVVKTDGATITDMVDITESTTYDISVYDANTDSVLDVIGADSGIVVGGLNKESESIRVQESIPSDKNVIVRMTVTPVSADGTDAAAAIEEYAADRNLTYYDFKVEKTVDSSTTVLDKTQNVLELVIPCSFTSKKELAVYGSDNSGVRTLTESGSKEPGTYRVDANAGMVYVYTDQISTYALGYKPYYSVKSEISLGGFTGSVSVKLTKDGESIYELNNVSLDNVSFKGVPKGTYSMTITWTDGAENTLTTPFIIK